MMRTKLIIGILIFIGINSGFSQEAGKVTSNRINEAVDSLHFEWVKNDSAFILQPRSTLDTNSYLSSYTLNVIEDDIVMQYSLKPKPRSVQRGISYYYSINVRGQLGDLSVSIGQHNAIFTPELKNGLSSRMVLINFMDKYPEWIQEGEQFQITFTAQLIQEYYLDRPTFTFQQQLPNYIAIGGAAALMIVGNQQYDEAKKTYNQYRAQTFQDEATPLYNQAEDKRKRARIISGAGIALATIGVATLTYRWLAYSKKKKQYDEFKIPEQRVGIQLPKHFFINGEAYAGIGLTYTF
jgi:hypothetical protein